MNNDTDDHDYSDFVECWQCSGIGLLAGCFEDCCSGGDCDPDDPENCCSPSRCDICRGKGGWHREQKDDPSLPVNPGNPA